MVRFLPRGWRPWLDHAAPAGAQDPRRRAGTRSTQRTRITRRTVPADDSDLLVPVHLVHAVHESRLSCTACTKCTGRLTTCLDARSEPAARLALGSLLAGQGPQVQGDGPGVVFVETEGRHGGHRLLPLGVFAGHQE